MTQHKNHVIALSGGKDSTALALRLAEVEPRAYTYICTPTGDELPEMLAHWERLEELLGQKIVRIASGWTLNTLIADMECLPNHRARWCTRILKIEPCIQYLEDHAPAVLYVGLRADEPERRGGIYDDVEQRYPLREWGWTITDVMEYLKRMGVAIPKRTDCARCYHQRLSEWWDLWRDYPRLFEEAAQQEDDVSERRDKRYTFRSPQRDTWPADLRALGARFANGERPRGVGQQSLFDDDLCRVCSL